MGTVPTMSGVSSMSCWRNWRVLPELERSMMASAPKSSAILTFFHSSAASALSPEMPRLTLTLVDRPSPTPKACMPFLMCTMLAGMAMRPSATRSRMYSGSRCSRSATSFICGVICPARAKSICVTSLGSVCVLIGTAPFVGITHIRFAGQGGRAQSQPAVLSCKLPVYVMGSSIA